jgi:hypothetical protein
MESRIESIVIPIWEASDSINESVRRGGSNQTAKHLVEEVP